MQPGVRIRDHCDAAHEQPGTTPGHHHRADERPDHPAPAASSAASFPVPALGVCHPGRRGAAAPWRFPHLLVVAHHAAGHHARRGAPVHPLVPVSMDGGAVSLRPQKRMSAGGPATGTRGTDSADPGNLLHRRVALVVANLRDTAEPHGLV